MDAPRRYNAEMEAVIAGLDPAARPRLLLHSCCGPCSSSVLERLIPHFDVTVFYYNPNILPSEEYARRLAEQRRLIAAMALPVTLTEGPYEPDRFLAAVTGLEDEPEGGRRCARCFALRMGETARRCAAGEYDWFCTTLTVSPHKNAAAVNAACEEAAAAAGARALPADFKKRDGYLRSLALSRQFGLYRQDYCGCPFGRRE